MERRTFFKTAGLITASTAFTNNVFAHLLQNQESSVKEFPSDELVKSLEKFINKYFQGETLRPDIKVPEGTIYLSKSYCTETICGKNSIYDIADLVIDHCEAVGFDASKLKDNILPTKMKVGLGSISIEVEQSTRMIRFEELKNYDAIMIMENPIIIKTELPPNAWKDIKKVELVSDSSMMDLFKGSRNEITLKKRKQPIEVKLAVETLNPDLAFVKGHSFRLPLFEEIGKEFFNEKTKDLLFSV